MGSCRFVMCYAPLICMAGILAVGVVIYVGSISKHSHSPQEVAPLPNTNNSTYGGSKNNSTRGGSENVGEWNQVVHLLGSKGYSSFSIALHSVLDGIQKDLVGLGYATILAPPDLNTTLLGYSSTLLDRAVRLHILPRRFTYKDLIALPVNTSMKTLSLMPEDDLEIGGVLDIDGVKIVAPDLITSDTLVVHGISRAFKMA